MKRTFLLLLLLVLAGWLLTGVVEVRPGERAVVRRFGRVLDHKPKPGLWVGLPWGIDRVDRVPVDLVRRVVVGYQPESADNPALGRGLPTAPGQLLTGDHNLVNVQVTLFYSVIEDQVEDYVIQADRADELVARAAETALAEWVAGRTVDDVLLHGKAQLPAALVAKTQERIAPYRLGIQVREEASITHLYPPDEVRAAFDEVTRAQTTMRTNKYKAEQEAERLWREAESDKFRIEQLTAAYVRTQRLLAQAEADTFDKRRQQYHRLRAENPAFLAGIWWEEMGKLFTSMRDNGRIDLLDHHLGGDGLDITVFPPAPKKK
jgi:membrane protease subunit HflK